MSRRFRKPRDWDYRNGPQGSVVICVRCGSLILGFIPARSEPNGLARAAARETVAYKHAHEVHPEVFA